jgi:hypothetical protein
MEKIVYYRSQKETLPDPLGQVNENLLNACQASLNSKHPLIWKVLPGIPYLNGFIGFKESESAKTEALIEEGKITPYPFGEGEVFLISDIVELINRDPVLKRVSWNSYKHTDHSPEEQVIYYRKYWYPDHMLLKYNFRKETFYACLPVAMWSKPVRTGNALIKLINRTLKAGKNARK